MRGSGARSHALSMEQSSVPQSASRSLPNTSSMSPSRVVPVGSPPSGVGARSPRRSRPAGMGAGTPPPPPPAMPQRSTTSSSNNRTPSVSSYQPSPLMPFLSPRTRTPTRRYFSSRDAKGAQHKDRVWPKLQKAAKAHRFSICMTTTLLAGIVVMALLYTPTASRPAVKTAEAHEVLQWAQQCAPCGGSGTPTVPLPNGTATFTAHSSVGEFSIKCVIPALSITSYATMAVTVVALVLMINNLPPDLVLVGATLVLVMLKIIDHNEAWSGLSNSGVMSVAVLFIVAQGLQEVGVVDMLLRKVLGQPSSMIVAQLRLQLPVAIVSAFMNNTPVVAMLIPIVESWSERIQMSKTKFLIPLSYSSMLGGMCSLLGTSTNLILAALILKEDPAHAIGMFSMTPVGAPLMITGVLYLSIASRWLLPSDRSDGTSKAAGEGDDLRNYESEFCVTPGSSATTMPLANTGLLRLKGVRVVAVVRGSTVLEVDPTMTLKDNDRLVVNAVPEGLARLRRERGLVVANPSVLGLGARRRHRRLVEVVLSRTNPLVGFRPSKVADVLDREFNAAIVAVRHNATSSKRRLRTRSADQQLLFANAADNNEAMLAPGDALVLETYKVFLDVYVHSPQFALVREVLHSKPPRFDTVLDKLRGGLAVLVLVAMVISAATNVVHLLTAALVASFVLIGIKALTVEEAFRAIKGRVILAIVATFGLGAAMDGTGVAAFIANGLVKASMHLGEFALLATIFIVVSVVSAVVSNNATVILMFPICVRAQQLVPSIPIRQFVIVLMMAASTSFATPIGYQTNLMVMAPGRYKFTDFVKIGLPLQIILCVLCVFLTRLFIS